MLILLLACASEPETTPPETVPLEGAALLRRISLDLRGEPPSIEELDAIEADPDALDGLVDQMLDSDAFEARWMDVLGEQWLTRVDEFNAEYDELGFASTEEYAFLRGVGEEPLRLMAYIVRQDEPWSAVATADYTMTNDTLMSIWDVEPIDPDDARAWRPARYLDGRPALGVMATNGLWWRYATTLNNLNRGRAAALSRLLLCYDFLARPVAFEGITDFSSEALNAATRTDPTCESCHSGLDPLAATLFGFWWYDNKDATDMGRYHPSREPLGEEMLELSPSYFGSPVQSASQLGLLVANDVRFGKCAVERTARALWHRDPDADDFGALQDVLGAYEADGGRISAAIRAVLDTEEYRAGALGEGADEALEERVQTARLLGVGQMRSAILALTGFEWTWEGWDQLDNDVVGYRVMGGGVDGTSAVEPTRDPTVTRALVLRRAAQGGAAWVVAHDLAASPDERTLFSAEVADLAALDPADQAFDAEVEHLSRRILSVRPDADALAEYETLWSAVEAQAGVEQAWASLVSVMLRDPAFWSY